jgi:hypothetical protein
MTFSYGKGDQVTYLQVATDIMTYQLMTFSYGKGDQVTYLQVATDMMAYQQMTFSYGKGDQGVLPAGGHGHDDLPVNDLL